jgi:branched-chain amino acid transport system permease protein
VVTLPGARPAAGLAAAFRAGLAGGLFVLLLALVGMLEDFSGRFIVARLVAPDGEGRPTLEGVLTLAQAVWWGLTVAIGYLAARRAGAAGGMSVAAGALAGLAVGLVLAGLLVVGGRVNLRPVLVNATPALYELLTFGRAGGSGVALTIGLAAALGAAGGLLRALPGRLPAALGGGVAAVVVAGALQQLLVILLPGSGGLEALLFTRQGLSLTAAVLLFLATAAVVLVGPRARAGVEAGLDARPHERARAVRGGGRLLGAALAVGLLLWLPLASGSYVSDVLDTVGLFVLMGLGLNIVVGYAGLLDLGYVAFFAIGAYTIGALTSPEVGIRLSDDVVVHLGFWQALPIAVVLSVLSGILLGVPVLKTHGDYLAIITLGFGEIIRILAISDVLKPWLGGAQGITLIPEAVELPRLQVPLVGVVDPTPQQELFFPILAACAVALYVAWRLRNSRYGRAWTAVREDEPVAQAMGIDLVHTKLLAFAVGAAFAGLSGALFASKLASIYPHSFNLLISINVLVLIIVGGMGSLPGVIVGALALVGLPELLREFSDYRLLLYGAVLVVMMLTRPEGLWPSRIRRRELADANPAPAPVAVDQHLEEGA